MRKLVPILLASLVAGCNSSPAVEVSEASVRLPVVAGRPGVAYFTLRTNKMPMQILGLSSPQIERIEFHESKMSGQVMRMGPLHDHSLGPDGVKEFEPGGPHAMLFGIAPAVRAGGTVSLTFDFDNAPDVTLDVPVETVAGH